MTALSTSTSVHVQPQVQLVSMATGVEGSRVERHCSSRPSFISPSLHLGDLPDECSTVRSCLQVGVGNHANFIAHNVILKYAQ